MKSAENIFSKKLFNKQKGKNPKLIKTLVFKKVLTFSIIIYYLLFPTNFLIRKKLIEKMSNLSPVLQKEIEDYLLPIPSKYEKHKNRELVKVINYLQLKNYTAITNNTLRNQTQIELFNELKSFSKKQDKNISEVKIIYLKQSLKFGNSMILLNNLIAYCEVLDIRNIYLNIKMNWPIVDDLFTENINIYFIEPYQIKCNDKAVLCADYEPFFYLTVVKPEIRLSLFKNEVKRNLPMINVDRNDLYVHIRSGDIFKKRPNPHYAQPPLCFYKTIMNNFKFRNIYIIAENKKNPVIDKILERYPNIIHKEQDLSTDIAYLSNAYNLVASVSSFFLVLVKFNDNLKKYFEYDIYKTSEKFIQLHHDFYYFPMNFTIYRMEPSINYKNEMFVFENKESQYKLMLDEKCINNFTIIEPNV